jgi:hypothetical protein
LEREEREEENRKQAVRNARAQARAEQPNNVNPGGLFGNNNRFVNENTTTGRAANNAGERVNNYGQNVGNLFASASNAPASYEIARGTTGRAPNRINEYGEGVGNLFASASNAPASYKIARGAENKLPNSMFEGANQRLTKSLGQSNPLIKNKNLEAFKARKKAATPAVGLAAGAAALNNGVAAATGPVLLPGQVNANNAPRGKIANVANLTADERKTYNAMIDLGQTDAEALRNLQLNRNRGLNRPFNANRVPVMSSRKRILGRGKNKGKALRGGTRRRR